MQLMQNMNIPKPNENNSKMNSYFLIKARSDDTVRSCYIFHNIASICIHCHIHLKIIE